MEFFVDDGRSTHTTGREIFIFDGQLIYLLF